MNDKSKVKNLCSWQISWQRITQQGDETLKPNATVYITNSEIESQVLNNNQFFTGTDERGTHAKVLIENDELKEQLGFENKEEKIKQFVLDDDKCQSILDLKTPSAFRKNLEENVVTQQEKNKIIDYARKIKLNDYSKIQMLEEYCEIKFKAE